MGIPPSTSFFNLVRNFNPIREQTMPQIASAFGSYGQQVLEQFKKYFTAKNSSDPIEKLATFFANLDGELASISDPGIVSGWIEFFKSQGPNVRTKALSKLGSPQFLDKSFPPSANHLITAENIFSQNVIQQTIDAAMKIPNLISTGVQLPGYIQTNIVQASHALGEIFKSNITPALGKLAKNTDPHQGNLVPDSKHPERIGAAASKFVEGVINSFGSAASYMSQVLGFNDFSVQNKNVSSPNYKLNVLSSQQQQVRMNSLGSPEFKDTANLKRFKAKPSI